MTGEAVALIFTGTVTLIAALNYLNNIFRSKSKSGEWHGSIETQIENLESSFTDLGTNVDNKLGELAKHWNHDMEESNRIANEIWNELLKILRGECQFGQNINDRVKRIEGLIDKRSILVAEDKG